MRPRWCLLAVLLAFQSACGLTASPTGGSRSQRPDGGTQGEADAGGDGGSDTGTPTCGWQPYDDGLSGASIDTVRYDPRSPGLAYATSGGALLTTDAAGSWGTRGSLASGAFRQLAFPGADPNELLAATGIGIAASHDAGRTWKVVSLSGLDVTALGVSPSRPLRVYAGLHGGGIFVSDDGGLTWPVVGQGLPHSDALAIDVDPRNPDIAVAAAEDLNSQNAGTFDGELMRTADGGHTWQTVLPDSQVPWDLQRCATDSKVLYAATWSGVAKSIDGGLTWTEAGPQQINSVAISPASCDTVYAWVYGRGMEASTDGGQTFGMPETDGFDSLPLGAGTLAVNPSNGAKLLVGDHSDLWQSSDAGAHWTRAPGLKELKVTSLAASTATPGRTWLTTWGQGTWERNAGDAAWKPLSPTQIPTGYVFSAIPDPYTSSRVLIGTWSTLMQSNDGVNFSADDVTSNAWDVAFNPKDANVMYAASETGGIFKTVDGGSHWAAANAGLEPWDSPIGSALDVSAVAVDPLNPQTVFAGTLGGGLLRSTDGAATWQTLFAPQATTYVRVVAAHGVSSVYASIAGQGIERSDDDGASWTDISAGLPVLDTSGVLNDPATGNLYVATSRGVFVKPPDEPWTGLDVSCLPDVGAIGIATDDGSLWLLAGAQGTVFRHRI